MSFSRQTMFKLFSDWYQTLRSLVTWPLIVRRPKVGMTKQLTVSTAHLKVSLPLQLQPINPVVYRGSLTSCDACNTYLKGGFPLICFQRLSLPYLATQRVHLAMQLAHQGYVLPNPLVLGKNPFNIATPTADRDRPGSRRSEPSSRTTLMGEQPNPWDRLQPQDVMSRHRGAKPLRRYGRSGAISLLSPGYLLSVERRPFHTVSPDH